MELLKGGFPACLSDLSLSARLTAQYDNPSKLSNK